MAGCHIRASLRDDCRQPLNPEADSLPLQNRGPKRSTEKANTIISTLMVVHGEYDGIFYSSMDASKTNPYMFAMKRSLLLALLLSAPRTGQNQYFGVNR